MTTTAVAPGSVTIASATLMTAVAGYVDAFLYLRHHTAVSHAFGPAFWGAVVLEGASFVVFAFHARTEAQDQAEL
jgi:hypothetical protein